MYNSTKKNKIKNGSKVYKKNVILLIAKQQMKKI